jgi:G3E family GTPase
MMLYFLTGFLGAGKTTLLKELIRLFPNKRLAIIVNEFGKESIDGILLKDTECFSLSEISDGSIFCSCRLEQFEEALIKTASQKPDIIIVEASGLSNPQNIHAILREPAFSLIELKGSICLVDALNFHKIVNNALACRQQLSAADIVIINKIDLVSEKSLEQTKKLINSIAPDVPVFETSFGKIKTEWLEALQNGENTNFPVRQVQDITLQKFMLDVTPVPAVKDLKDLLSAFAGDTYRIKGFVHKDGEHFHVDCVGSDISIIPYSGPVTALNRLVVLSGNGLPAYKSMIKAVEPYGFTLDMIK